MFNVVVNSLEGEAAGRKFLVTLSPYEKLYPAPAMLDISAAHL